jgi:anti-anti-sigma factor
MAGPFSFGGGLCPVWRLNRYALVQLPERVDQSNAGQVRDELLAVADQGVLVLLADLTGTVACDYACGDALARVFQRAMTRGVELRLVAVTDDALQVLAMCGLDRVVPVYETVGAALTAGAFGDAPPAPRTAGDADDQGAEARFPGGDVGVEIALLDARGVIVWVNSAWRAFTAANGGDPAAAGPGVSYLDVCAAAAGDVVTARVEAAIRRALRGDLPGSFTIEVPCHSPGMARWFDLLISSRLDEDGKSAGATVTLSLARSHSRTLLAASRPGPGEPGRDLVSGMADRLDAVSDLLEVSVARTAAPVSDYLEQAISELTAVIRDARTASPEFQP